jgi:hypothetical protein
MRLANNFGGVKISTSLDRSTERVIWDLERPESFR